MQNIAKSTSRGESGEIKNEYALRKRLHMSWVPSPKKKKKKKSYLKQDIEKDSTQRFKWNTKGKRSPNSVKSKEKASGSRERKTNGQRIFTEEMSARTEKSSLS